MPRFVIAGLLFGAALFGPAGTVAWPMAWVWMIMTMAGMTWTTVWMARQAPDLLAERTRIKPDAKRWDKPLASSQALLLPLGLLVVAGLDRRFGWSGPLPAAVAIGALAVSMAGSLLIHQAMVANPFFSSVVRIQRDRGHHVVARGPYRAVRHPGYAGVLAFYLPLPLILGSTWAWIPAALIAAVTVVRTTLEERTLRRELEGYRAYAARVRYRLVPGVW